MNNIIKVLLVVFISFLSSPSWSETVSMDELVERNELYYKKFTDTPFTGEVDSHDKGIITYGKIKNGKRDGVWERYYLNGQLYQKENYKNGKEEGLFEEYFENGQLKGKGILKEGKQEGLWKEYYETGELLSTGIYKNGKEEGLWESYNKNGQLSYTETYKDGKTHGPWKMYFEDGQLEEKGTDKDGKKEGLSESYYQDGQLKIKQTYKDGKKEGLFEKYNEFGQLWVKGIFKDGKRDGLWKEYYESGHLWEEITYKDGKENGLNLEYYQSGQLGYKTYYEDGKENGLVEEFFEDGNLKNSYKMKNDKIFEGLFKVYDDDGYVEKLEFYKNYKSLDKYVSHNLIYEEDGTYVRLKDFEWFEFIESEDSSVQSQILKIFTVIDTETHKPFTGEYVYINESFSGVTNFIDGRFEKKGSEFNSDGKRVYRGESKNGMEHGFYELTDYNKSGLIEQITKGQFYLNKKDGLWEFFDEDGSLLRTETWIDGVKQ